MDFTNSFSMNQTLFLILAGIATVVLFRTKKLSEEVAIPMIYDNNSIPGGP